jgi:hypothetical protein
MSVSQSGTRNQFFFILETFFRHLRVYFIAPSLTRARVCNLLLLLVLTRAVPLGSVSCGTQPYFIVPFLETPPTWRTGSLYLYPPGAGWPRYSSGHWVPFPSPLSTRRATVGVFYSAFTRDNKKMHNEDHHNLYPSPHSIKMIKSRKMI